VKEQHYMNELITVAVAVAVPIAITLLQYAPYLLTHEPKIRPADVLAMGAAYREGLVQGLAPYDRRHQSDSAPDHTL
jgi:hypothetical protein